MPLDLPTAGFRNATVTNQVNGIGWEIMLRRHSPTNPLQIPVPVDISSAYGLSNDNQLLPTLVIHRECSDRTGLHRIAGSLDRLLNVLRVAIDPADNDHVFDATGNVDLAIVQETEVAGPQIGPISVNGGRVERPQSGIFTMVFVL